MTFCFVVGAVAAASLCLGVFFLSDGAVRKAIQFSLARRVGGLFSPRLIVVGDSLAASCPWRRLAAHPFAVLNLAMGGATLKEIAGQIYRSRDIAADFLLVNGGLNDLLFDQAEARQIEADFLALSRRIEGRTVIVTLMPFTSDPARTAHIVKANELLSRLCRQFGYCTVDLNASVSVDGVRRPDMTEDGLHFTGAADRIWLAAIRDALSRARI
ncbi:GDSL-type esterase/lipase family protein [Methylocystis echinoides]|uniref:SGNH/GDSL hydrolase family protein n=1 Tax=Methylocystis echinoides TaxID=29468 RepID=UPI003429661F